MTVSASTAARVSRQALFVTAGVVVYFGVRGLTDASATAALRNAGDVVAVERLLNLDLEVPLQQLVVGRPELTRVLNWIYIFGHWPVIAVTLLWLAVRHRGVFVRVRNAMLISGSVGLVAFAVFPVAPPRLADGRLVDTVTLQSDAYRILQPPAFTNQYAAMPSLHVGWNLLMTLAILAAARSAWLRVVAVGLMVAMDASVVLTANHYLIDGIAGAALASGAWRVAAHLNGGRAVFRTRAPLSGTPSPVLPTQRGPLPVPVRAVIRIWGAI